MTRIYRTAQRILPVSKRLAWARLRIERVYEKDITAAQRAKDFGKANALKEEMRFELDLQREEEDAHQTRVLLRKARRLYVPIPQAYDKEGNVSPNWYEGSQTGGMYLTVSGIQELRNEVRAELKARHEQIIVWLSAATGILGAITGLAAVLKIHS